MSETSKITEVVFVDAAVAVRSPGLLTSAQAEGRQVVVLDPAGDGLSQIASVLRSAGPLDAVHLLGHGDAGRLWLGGKPFDADQLLARSADLADLGAALRPGGDLLLYGCDIASGNEGVAFIEELARLTGANVAASDDATGVAALGGDHQLEARTGSIEADVLDLSALNELLAPSVANLDASKTFVEGGSATVIDDNLSITGETSYGGGYLQFALSSAHSGDQFVLGSSATPNANGAISVDGGVVYLGNGSGRDVIGAVDSTFNGQNGNLLRINFTSPFTNPGFEGNSSLGWTIGEQFVNLGSTTIAGYTSPNDPTDPPNSGGDNDVPESGSYNSDVSTTDKTEGDYSLRLYSSIGTANGYDVVHGPYAYSTPFEAASGDVIYFDWRALAGGDAYDVFAYILNVNTGATQIILNETGANDTGNTNWATASVTIPTTGDWRFVFVAGTYDFTGGQVAGGSLYIDNVRVFGTKVNSSVISDIAQQVTYQNTATDSPPSRTLTITAQAANGTTGSATTTLNVTQLNNAPSFTAGTSLAAVDEDTPAPAGATVSSLFGARFSDPDAALTPADTLGGIALTGNAANAATQGSWEYSTDGGSSWHAVGSVSNDSALLLSTASMVRFLPVANYHGTPGALTAHAVDSTHSGGYSASATRATFDTTSDAGDSAVSAAGVALTTSITSVNDAPVYTSTAVSTSRADTSAVDNFSTTTGTITASDVDADTLSYGITGGTASAGQVVRTGTYGSLSIDTSTGAYVFTPNASAINALQSGAQTETFTVTVSDGTVSVDQTFTFQVTGTNDLPVGVADTGAAVESGGTGNDNSGSQASGNVLSNDTDPDTGATFSLTGFGHGSNTALPGQSIAGQYGTLTLLANGNYTYTVDENNSAVEGLTGAATLTDTFSYGLQDNLGATSTSTLSITIGGANEAPVGANDSATAAEASGTGNSTPGLDPTGNVLTNDVDFDLGDVLSVASFASVGTLASGAAGASVTGTYGTLTLLADGSYHYVVDNTLPAVQALRTAGQTVSDSFTYTVQDQDGLNDTATLTVTIGGRNDTPTAQDDYTTGVENNGSSNGTQGVTPRGNVFTNDRDPDAAANGETATLVNFGRGAQTAEPGAWFQGTYGRVSIGADGRYVYDIDETHPSVQALRAGSSPLSESFNYLMRDADGATSTAMLRVEVRGANEAPQPQPDVAIAIEDGAPVTGNLLTNDVDADLADRITVSSVGEQQGRYGTLSLDEAGHYTYVVNHALPEVQQLVSSSTVLTESFTYAVRDTAGAESTSTLTIEIHGSNDAPQPGTPLGQHQAVVGSTFNLVLPAGAVSDVDGNLADLRYSATLFDGRALPSWLSIDPRTGTLSGTPANGDETDLSLAITATDAYGAHAVIGSAALQIVNPNDAPEFRTPLTLQAPESRTLVVRLQADDADGDTVVYRLSGGADQARFEVDAATGTLRFLQAPDFEQPGDADGNNRYEITIEASDGRGGVTTRTHVVNVTNLAEQGDDLDGDGAPDSLETGRDTDGDGIDDALDADDDGDGVDSALEAGVPGGDGNGDGVPDTLQSHVSSRPVHTDGEGTVHHVTLVAEPGAGGSTATAQLTAFAPTTPPTDLPAGLISNHAPLSFSAILNQAGQSQTFTLYLAADSAVQGLWLQDAQGQWHDVHSSVEQVGDRWKLSFELQDGGPFDTDGRADGALTTGAMVATSTGLAQVYRFFNTDDGVQFHTASSAERDALLEQGEAMGWRYEGVAFSTPLAPEGVPVWRFFHEASGDHFYTATAGERDALLAGDFGYTYEGASFQILPQPDDGTVAVHRYYNVDTADHYYTTDTAQQVTLVAAGYDYEGVLGYVVG